MSSSAAQKIAELWQSPVRAIVVMPGGHCIFGKIVWCRETVMMVRCVHQGKEQDILVDTKSNHALIA